MISKDTIERVFSTLQIEEVIGDFVQLKRSGANYKGLSPFSDEKTPSFMVSPAKGIWKDFSSGKGGNAVTFVMEVEHCSYPEAIRYIARKYNIDIEETEVSSQEKEAAQERDSLYIVTEYAATWFKKQMHDTATGRNVALSYFRSRDINDAMIERFALGYCPDDWDAFTRSALEAGYRKEYLEKTGLTIFREDGKCMDRFRSRVIFPIHTFSGRVAGFGGRTMQSEKSIAKYLNSPESDIYHKSDILYGIYQGKNAIIKQDSCYLVEGYMDVISLHQSGIENVVASSGTSLTEGQIRQIKRLTQNITVLYDGDAAGIRASFRGIDMLLAAGMNVRVLSFPDGDDPDSFARKHTATELRNYLEEERTDFIDFKARMLLDEAQGDPILKSRLVRDIVVSISKISDHIKRELYIKECSRIMDVSEASLFRELSQIDHHNAREYQQAAQRAATRAAAAARLKVAREGENTQEEDTSIIRLEKDIISLLLHNAHMPIHMEEVIDTVDENGNVKQEKHSYDTTVAREVIDSLTADGINFTDSTLSIVYNGIKSAYDAGEEISHHLFLTSDNTDVITAVSDIMTDSPALHKWDKVGIDITEYKYIAHTYTRDLILRYRVVMVDKMIKEACDELSRVESEGGYDEELIKKLMLLRNISTRLNKELGGRVV
ncbi:MAG: DNA primase [Flavobacteriales bacterium]|nr:DNA primase [Flavobacteriales bacterium]